MQIGQESETSTAHNPTDFMPTRKWRKKMNSKSTKGLRSRRFIMSTISDGRSRCYGMEVHNYPSFSAIYLVSPLTKEMISTNNGGISRNNGGGLNYGGGGTIESVDDDSQVLVVVYEAKTN